MHVIPTMDSVITKMVCDPREGNLLMHRSVRVRAITTVALVLMQLLSVAVWPGGTIASAQSANTPQVAPNRYIVRLKDTQAGFTSAAAIASTYDARPGVTVDQVYSNVFNGFAGEFSAAAAAALLKDPNVLDVAPDGISTLQAQYDLPGIHRVGADLNPTKAGDGSGAVDVDVAVLDTGVEKHADLNVYRGKDCTSGSSKSDAFHDFIGHGTHVAGSIAAKDNGIGVVGVAPGARIWAIKVFSDGQDPDTAQTLASEIICGLDYVRANAGAIEVLNLSIGSGEVGDIGGCAATAYHDAYCRVVNAGVTVVVAAGNNFGDAANYVPSQFDEVITVSAYFDADGQPGGLGGSSSFGYPDDSFAAFSNAGADVDLAAPGVDILSTASSLAEYVDCELGVPYCYLSGTSMAAPHVAGGAALVIAQKGRMSPANVKARLRLTGMPGGLPGDWDGINEPLMNVAYLGTGKIAAPTSAKVGDTIQVRVGDYTPDTRAIFRFNGTYIGGDWIDDAGRGHRNYTIPNLAAGTYKAAVSNGLKSVSKNVKIVSSLTLSRTSAPVGETVTITMRGFGKGEIVSLKFGSKSLGSKTMTSNGYGTLSFTIPTTTGGYYAVTATGNQGHTVSTSLKVIGSAWVSSGTPKPGAAVTIAYRGFKAGEHITMKLDTQSGTVVNTLPETASSTGSGSDGVKIPAATSEGGHYLWLIGDKGTKVRILLGVVAAEAPTPTQTPTATVTAEPTETPEPTVVSPTETTPPELPTETPTVELPTETPTVELPTETPTAEAPTETPTAVVPPTDVPTEAPVVEASPGA